MKSSRLAVTYYRSFILFIVLPLLIIIGAVLGVIRSNTLEAAVSQIELTQQNIAAALAHDIEGASMQLSHFLLANDNRALELASRVVFTTGQENYRANIALQELYNFTVPPNASILGIHFYAIDGSNIYLKDALPATAGEVREMPFYQNALNTPERISIDFVSSALTHQGARDIRPVIAVSFAPRRCD